MKAIVIGSGIAGIATAIRLAHRGMEVDVMEANPYPGGKLTEFSQQGFRFDAGPSLFTLPNLVTELFELTGRPASDFPYQTLPVACHYFWEDGARLKAYTDPERFGKEVEEQLQVPKERVTDYLDQCRKKYDLTSGIFLEKSLHRLGTYLSGDVLRTVMNIFSLDLMTTMDKVNQKRLVEPHLVQLFDRFATYNGSSPFQAPGVLNMIPHLEHNLGTFFPEGGMHSITNKLVNLARELGVKFLFNAPVEKINTVKNKAVGVRRRGQDHHADLVVSNMDIVPTYRRLLPDLKAPEKTLKQERSSSALIFYWGIKAQFPELDLHNIFFSEDYPEEFRHIFKLGKVYEDPTVYINISSKNNPQDAPQGGENWFVMVNVPADNGQNWEAIIPTIRKNVLTKIERILGTTIEDKIATEAMLDPIGIADKTFSFRGALYGASSNHRLSAFFRHPNFSRKLSNLYFCGGSVHPGGGIPLCLLSARIVDELIAQDHL